MELIPREASAQQTNATLSFPNSHAGIGSDFDFIGRSTFDELPFRVRDLVGAALLLLLFSPVMLVIAALIKLDSRGPVLFAQRRGGLRCKTFYCFKFRTMSVLEDGTQIRQAQRDDKRITRVGRILRRTSLDELPQLFNVLLGHMSLVGPRPHALAHDTEYGAKIPGYRHRASIKPGITGLAQTCGLRGECETLDMMAARVSADLFYIAHRSFLGDLKILLVTPLKLLGCTRSY